MPVPTRAFAAGLAAAAGLALSACGGASDEEQVRDTVEGFGQASALKDYQRICDRLISRRLSESVERVNVPCEVAFRRGLEQVEAPRLKVREIKILGDGKASVRVLTTAKGQPASSDVVQLVREDGEWRIAALARPE